MKQRPLFRRIVAWLLFATIITYGVTGFGITRFRIVESLTFGLLTHNIAFKIHILDYLWVPFVILLGLHIFFALYSPRR